MNFLTPPSNADEVTLTKSSAGSLSRKAIVPLTANGASASGTPATLICQLAAAAGKRLEGWVVMVRAGSSTTSNVRVIVTYSDDTTEQFDTSAVINIPYMATPAGALRMDAAAEAVVGFTAGKTVKSLRAETLGAGVASRSACIVALEVPA